MVHVKVISEHLHDLQLLSLQVVIEGVVGSGYRGDIAIDDVAMTSGSCGQGKSL